MRTADKIGGGYFDLILPTYPGLGTRPALLRQFVAVAPSVLTRGLRILQGWMALEKTSLTLMSKQWSSTMAEEKMKGKLARLKSIGSQRKIRKMRRGFR